MILSYPLPSAINGIALAEEVAAALGLPPPPADPTADADVMVSLVGDTLEIVVPDGTDEPMVAAVVSAHTGALTPEQQAEADAEAEFQVTRQQLANAVVKARSVWAGDSTYTAAQLQRTVAGLVILVARRLR